MNNFSAVETQHKDRILGLYSQARQLAIGRDYAQALELYDKIIADVPRLIFETPRINYERALCLKALGRIEQAEQAIRSCLSVRNDDPEFLRFLSEIQVTKRKCEDSREPKVKPPPPKAKKAPEADHLYADARAILSLVEKIDVERALRAISLIEEQMIGRWCGELGDKLLQYLSIVQVARATGNKTVDSIEIGTLFGGSCLAKLFAMRDIGVQGKIVCIDPMMGYYDQQLDPKAGLPVTAEVFFRNIDNFGFSRESIDLRQVKSEDPRAIEGLREKSFATLLIDGDHCSQGVRSDWENYNKFVSDNGIVLFDDYANWRWPDIGVFVDELKGSLPGGWKELGCMGTTLLLAREFKESVKDTGELNSTKPALDADLMADRNDFEIQHSKWLRFNPSRKEFQSGKQLFFISGRSKCGNTWLGHLLNSHPQIFCDLTENNAFHQDMNFLFFGKSSSMLHEKIGTFYEKRFWSLIKNGFITNLVQRCEKDTAVRLGDKTPRQDVGKILTIFPETQIIVMMRDFRDALVSLAFHQQRNTGTWQGTFASERRQALDNNFIKGSLAGFEKHSDIETYVNYSHKFPHQVLIVRYEDLKVDAVKTLQAVLSFLKVDSCAQIAEKCVRQNTFKKLSGGRKSGEENPNSFFRKGVVGDWKNYFTEENIEVFKKYGGRSLILAGYEKDNIWTL